MNMVDFLNLFESSEQNMLCRDKESGESLFFQNIKNAVCVVRR